MVVTYPTIEQVATRCNVTRCCIAANCVVALSLVNIVRRVMHFAYNLFLTGGWQERDRGKRKPLPFRGAALWRSLLGERLAELKVDPSDRRFGDFDPLGIKKDTDCLKGHLPHHPKVTKGFCVGHESLLQFPFSPFCTPALATRLSEKTCRLQDHWWVGTNDWIVQCVSPPLCAGCMDTH